MKNIELINAGAGSGKTYKLTSLVVERILEGVMPRGLMATTFTKKAAAELRERIRVELIKHGKNAEAGRIFDGFVGTVNSICARLLSEYALDAGLSPALDVLPEEDGERLFRIAIEEAINSRAAGLDPAAKRLSRAGGGSGYGELPDWRGDVRKIVELARANQLGPDNLADCARKSWDSLSDLFGRPLHGDSADQLAKAVKTAIEKIKGIAEPKGDTKKALDALKNFDREYNRNVFTWADWPRLVKLKTNKDGEDMLDEVIEIARDIMINPRFQEDVHEMIIGVFDCAGDAIQLYDDYKREKGLMDFVDQETKVLGLASSNAAFRASLKDRLQQIMVDEFQDTSPIQLALFLKLNELAGRSVWVGDPKQSIYKFRGTDPKLMEEVTKQLETTQTLGDSWRSQKALVDFSNAVFSEVFFETDPDKVVLKIPKEREEKAKSGWLESWNLCTKNNSDDAIAIAIGVKDMLEERTDIKPEDIAVLCRKHSECEAVAKSLEAIGIKASAEQGSLKDTRECRLAMAALRYMNDGRDTVALAEIVHLSNIYDGQSKWLSPLIADSVDAIAKWKQEPLIAALEEARDELNHWTPMEALETAIAKVDLPATAKSWTNTALRMRNIDALRGACQEYIDQCRARRSAATVAGFEAYLHEADPGQAHGSGDQTVQVQTYHGAKGLEWPVVVLAGLNSVFTEGAFGINIVPAKEFDPTEPLANRTIRYWPWPFGAQKTFPLLDDKLMTRVEHIEACDQAKRESRRLLYVGITRARDGMVFAIRKHETKTSVTHKTAWLNDLTDKESNPVLNWPLESGAKMLEIGDASISIKVREFSADTSGMLNRSDEPSEYLSPPIDSEYQYLPARLVASDITLVERFPEATAEQIADLGHKLDIKGQPDMALLGQAIHGFFGIDYPKMSAEQQIEIATGLLRRWGVERAMSPDDIASAGDRLQAFVENEYPNARILREWPVTLFNDDHRLMHGWVDLLLELPDGFVVIDHKSYPGAEAAEHAKQYAPQLASYKEAIEKATDLPVLATLIHLPVLGSVYQVDLS